MTTKRTLRCAGCWQTEDVAPPSRFRRRDPLCSHCASHIERRFKDDLPIVAYRDDIAALTADDWLEDWEIARLEEVQAPDTTWEGRSKTELARLVANFNDWRLFGNTLCTPDGMIVAKRLEIAATAMKSMKWFTAGQTGVDWSLFTSGRAPSTCTYPAAFALRRRIAADADNDS